jgi:hypothetical protein
VYAEDRLQITATPFLPHRTLKLQEAGMLENINAKPLISVSCNG